jgi:hypothetical protein
MNKSLAQGFDNILKKTYGVVKMIANIIFIINSSPLREQVFAIMIA